MKLKEPIIAHCPSNRVPACKPRVSSYCPPSTPNPSRDLSTPAGDDAGKRGCCSLTSTAVNNKHFSFPGYLRLLVRFY